MSRVVVPVIAALALVFLAGCTPESPAPNDTPGNASPVEQTPQPNPIPSLSPTGTPIDATCDDLVSAQTLYDYNPNFGEIGYYEPAAGTVGASALDLSGLACRWQNQTSNETIDLSVADVDVDSVTSLKTTAAENGSPVEVAGADEAYFSSANGVGAVVVFAGGYWMVVSSPFFTEVADASAIVEPALAALPAG